MKPLLIDLDYTLTDSFLIKEITTPYFKNQRHFHKDYELVFVLESSGKRVIGNHIENFKKGDLIFVGPNLPHAWYNEKEYYEEKNHLLAKSLVIYFRKSWLENEVLKFPNTWKLKKLFENAVKGIKIKGKTRTRISGLLLKINQSEGLKKVIDIFSVLHELAETEEYELLTSVGNINIYNKNEEQRINQVYEYVMNNFSSHINLEEAAGIANMSINAFCRYFKTHTQKKFLQFVNEVRVGHACKLLEEKDLTISQVCYESGFQSVTNFNKFFKKITHKSPHEYRNNLLNFIQQTYQRSGSASLSRMAQQ
ncbi:MAG: AraC family transcriptional regulator [Cyclobacteriaceae bacterium]